MSEEAHWRRVSSGFLTVGRSLSTIEKAMAEIRMTGVVTDPYAWAALQDAYTAARKMVVALDRLRNSSS